MEQKFKVNQMLTAKNTGFVEKIYAVSKDGQPFDLLEVSLLLHYQVLTMEQLRALIVEHAIDCELHETGHTCRVSLKTTADAEKFIAHIAPLYNQILL
ncbi:hypothetical protein [Kurthia sibirica]|uniref:Uncharacterized protein n=1 Tax=Kurthia sibirica TaxID=202750 RepID=A0A2U3AIZ3_9BACL|nr:hypothetical protein [Kurthia sibirica]PWI24500.1 hypothetical protein DEX24_12980 [Kurthia sibirica]GEK33564.1 hypothetical protein KSI01_10970 [Kurthia sibirica]